MKSSELPPHILSAIRGVRVITASSLGRLRRGPNGHYLCRWCLTETKPPRKTWCSDRCVGLFTELCASGQSVYGREQGICQGCQVSCSDLQDVLANAKYLSRQADSLWLQLHNSRRFQLKSMAETEQQYRELCGRLLKVSEQYPWMFVTKPIHKDSYRSGAEHKVAKKVDAWEVDHIVPVHKGGLSTEDQMQLLCWPCHQAKSKQEALERRKQI